MTHRVIGIAVAGALAPASVAQAQEITLRRADGLPTTHTMSKQTVDHIARVEEFTNGKS